MKQIVLTGKNGLDKYALVDEEDYEELSQYQWKCNLENYVYRSLGKQTIYLHRLIMKANNNFEVDHIDSNPLNNQRSNLRLVSHLQNSHNRAKQLGFTSRYKGVHWAKIDKKWRAGITVNYKKIYIGNFNNERHAALAYDMWATFFFKEYAKTNFKQLSS